MKIGKGLWIFRRWFHGTGRYCKCMDNVPMKDRPFEHGHYWYGFDLNIIRFIVYPHRRKTNQRVMWCLWLSGKYCEIHIGNNIYRGE